VSPTVSTIALRRLWIPAPRPTTPAGRSRFLLLGVAGYLVGGALGSGLAAVTGLSPLLVVLLTVLSGLTFFAVALVTKIVVGRESLIYLHHELAILAVTATVLATLHAPVLAYLDIVQIGVSTFLAFGRIGCWTAACCHGRPCSWGTTHGDAHVSAGLPPEYRQVPLFPTQLVEAALASALVVAGASLVLAGAPPGVPLTVSVVVYGVARWMLEPLRGDVGRAFVRGVAHTRVTILGQHLVLAGLALAGRLPLPAVWAAAAIGFLGLLGAQWGRPMFVPELIIDVARSVQSATPACKPILIERGCWRVSHTTATAVHLAVSCMPRHHRLEQATLAALALTVVAPTRTLEVVHAPRALHTALPQAPRSTATPTCAPPLPAVARTVPVFGTKPAPSPAEAWRAASGRQMGPDCHGSGDVPAPGPAGTTPAARDRHPGRGVVNAAGRRPDDERPPRRGSRSIPRRAAG
jgi:hypothetical protein